MVAAGWLRLVPLFAAEAAPGEAPRAAEIDPPTRAALLLALVGLILVGLVCMVLISVSARMVRRWARYAPPPREIGKPRPPAEPDLSWLDSPAAGGTATQRPETLRDDDANSGSTNA